MNKKAFTLIELLAVIIILGVLLLIAVPSVTKYITNSKIDTYEKNLAKLVDAVITDVNSGNSNYNFGANEYLVVPLTCIELENGSNTKSPFGEYVNEKSFIAVTRKSDNKGYNYYVNAVDVQGYGTSLSLLDKIQVVDSNNSYSVQTDNIAYIKSGKVSYVLKKTNDGSNTSFETDILNKTMKLLECSNFNINVSTIDDMKVGDYIDYTPEKGSYSVVGGDNGTGTDETQSFTTDTNLMYRVYNITNDYIEIVPATYANNHLTLIGYAGVNNGVSILNDLCKKLYSNSSIGAVARSFNQDDIDSKTTYDSQGYYHAYTGGLKIKVDPETCVWDENYQYCYTGERTESDYVNVLESSSLTEYYGTFGKKYPSIWQFDNIDDKKEIEAGTYNKVGRSSIGYSQIVDKNSSVYSYVLKKDGNNLESLMDRANNEIFYFQNKYNQKVNGVSGFVIPFYIDQEIETRNQIKSDGSSMLSGKAGRYEIKVDGVTNWYVVFDNRIKTQDIRDKRLTCSEIYYEDLNSSSKNIDRCLKVVDGYDYSDFKTQVYKKIGAYKSAWLATRIYEIDPDYSSELPIPVEWPHIGVINNDFQVQGAALFNSYTIKAPLVESAANVMPIIKIPINNVTFSKVGTDSFGYAFFKI